ncbi:hypothetical protein DVR12_04045 [Chitinophaga silvatica]|uniref:Uncharacterized protein n=1 Tax=Chitinophaga silvatica TaxID=2282649 RepID=A0A3E1YHV5_9BACT|nr:hypothetical protein [Chitinophaga silvatica]RFS26962.1 hypothetical protein DVR12_04045 [Chitinophaga silvatica]
MDLLDFKQSLQGATPPKNLNVYLNALWYDGKGDWKKAHDLVDGLSGTEAARIHAYLHRVEGDHWNANYWYRRAGEEMPACSQEKEWELLVGRFL